MNRTQPFGMRSESRANDPRSPLLATGLLGQSCLVRKGFRRFGSGLSVVAPGSPGKPSMLQFSEEVLVVQVQFALILQPGFLLASELPVEAVDIRFP